MQQMIPHFGYIFFTIFSQFLLIFFSFLSDNIFDREWSRNSLHVFAWLWNVSRWCSTLWRKHEDTCEKMRKSCLIGNGLEITCTCFHDVGSCQDSIKHCKESPKPNFWPKTVHRGKIWKLRPDFCQRTGLLVTLELGEGCATPVEYGWCRNRWQLQTKSLAKIRPWILPHVFYTLLNTILAHTNIIQTRGGCF